MGLRAYRIVEQRRFRRAGAYAQTRQSIRCSHTQSIDVDGTQAEIYTSRPTEYARKGVLYVCVFFKKCTYAIRTKLKCAGSSSDKIINFLTKSES